MIMKSNQLTIIELKQEVYRLTHTSTTKQFKERFPKYHKRRDLRYKKYWAEILTELIEHFSEIDSRVNEFNIASVSLENISNWLNTLEEADLRSEEKHRQMYFSTGAILGWSVRECEARWSRIQLQAQWEIDSEIKVDLNS